MSSKFTLVEQRAALTDLHKFLAQDKTKTANIFACLVYENDCIWESNDIYEELCRRREPAWPQDSINEALKDAWKLDLCAAEPQHEDDRTWYAYYLEEWARWCIAQEGALAWLEKQVAAADARIAL